MNKQIKVSDSRNTKIEQWAILRDMPSGDIVARPSSQLDRALEFGDLVEIVDVAVETMFPGSQSEWLASIESRILRTYAFTHNS